MKSDDIQRAAEIIRLTAGRDAQVTQDPTELIVALAGERKVASEAGARKFHKPIGALLSKGGMYPGDVEDRLRDQPKGTLIRVQKELGAPIHHYVKADHGRLASWQREGGSPLNPMDSKDLRNHQHIEVVPNKEDQKAKNSAVAEEAAKKAYFDKNKGADFPVQNLMDKLKGSGTPGPDIEGDKKSAEAKMRRDQLNSKAVPNLDSMSDDEVHHVHSVLNKYKSPVGSDTALRAEAKSFEMNRMTRQELQSYASRLEDLRKRSPNDGPNGKAAIFKLWKKFDSAYRSRLMKEHGSKK